MQTQKKEALASKPIDDFVDRFGTSLRLDESLIVDKQGRYFLLNQKLKKVISEDFFYAGLYLGKVKEGVFFPSFNLLAMITGSKEANKITVDEKTEWLFIVGRDVFKRGVLKASGSKNKGAYTLIMNRHGECLGFGRILCNLDDAKNKDKVVVRNVSDIGDFLRRERGHKG